MPISDDLSYLLYASMLNDFQIGDWYIDWCTGIDGFYGGPYEITDLERFEEEYIVSWGMIERVDKDHPKLPDPDPEAVMNKYCGYDDKNDYDDGFDWEQETPF